MATYFPYYSFSSYFVTEEVCGNCFYNTHHRRFEKYTSVLFNTFSSCSSILIVLKYAVQMFGNQRCYHYFIHRCFKCLRGSHKKPCSQVLGSFNHDILLLLGALLLMTFSAKNPEVHVICSQFTWCSLDILVALLCSVLPSPLFIIWRIPIIIISSSH